MRLGWAILIGLLLGGGLVWWSDRQDRRNRAADPTPTATPARPLDAGPARPVYRWRDERGVLQITDTPPRDRPYERVEIPHDRNIVPMTPPEPEN